MEKCHSCTELEAEKCMTLMNMLLHLTDSIRELAVAAESHGTIKTFWRCLNPLLQGKV